MGFGPFVLISLFYAVLGVRVVAQLARGWRQTFDRRFTPEDRSLVDQTAFFVLVPIAVALHELGHAVAIWLFGGRVEGWGYYGFAGFVAFDPTDFSASQRIVVAAAGTVVNLLLAAAAVAVVFGRRPPMRAAYNELLLQFVFISLLNALVVYPLLDLASGLNGDWRQMYFGGVPALSAAILVVHGGVLAALLWAWRSEAMRGRIAALTGSVGAPWRLRLDGRRPAHGAAGAGPTAAEAVLQEAASRVAAGWPRPVSGSVQRRGDGLVVALEWREGEIRRAVVAWAPTGGGVQLSGFAAVDGGPPQQWPLAAVPPPVDPDRLVLALRLAMEAVAARSVAGAAEPAAG